MRRTLALVHSWCLLVACSEDTKDPPANTDSGGGTNVTTTSPTSTSSEAASNASTADGPGSTTTNGTTSTSGVGGGTGGSSDSASASTNSGGAASTTSLGAGGDASASGDRPEAPILLSMTSVIHGTYSLDWENPASGCSVVEVNRSADQGHYAVSQTLTGEATSVTDSAGHDPGTFCYTITCVLSGVASLPSNEMCLTQ